MKATPPLTLTGTYWYVPEAYLPALQTTPGSNPTPMTDQTLWQITGAANGYFWGNCAALLYPAGSTPAENPNGLQLVGSITPGGAVQISFMPLNKLGATLATQGWGRLTELNGLPAFEMQMGTGTSALVSHWAFMLPTSEGQASWNQLPGTTMSVPEFLQAAGF